MKRNTLCFLTVLVSACVGEIDERTGAPTSRPVPAAGPVGQPSRPGVSGSTGPGAGPAGAVPPGASPAGAVTAVPADACANAARPAARIRRLTRTEYTNTVRDLLGEVVAPELLPSDPASRHFDTNPDLGVVSGADAEKYQLAARGVSAAALAKKNPLFACAGDEARCFGALLDGFGVRAFRRPLTRDERARYDGFFIASRAARAYPDTVRLFLQAILQSPSFLYRTELGPRPAVRGARTVALDPYEAAAALSYLFTGTLPDADLLSAASAGRLATAADFEGHARRLLVTPRGIHVVRQFFEQWLDLARVESLVRDAKTYPEWTPALARAVRVEATEFVDKVFWAGDARSSTLLGSSTTFAGAALGGLYGRPGLGSAPARQDLDPAERAGILTLPAVLALTGGNAGSSPLYRGKLVAEKLFCAELPAPPEGASQSKFDLKDPTPRQEAEARLGDPLCGGCHRLMDRAGFGLERYDGIGRFRTAERGQPIDGRGELLVSGDSDGVFDGPRGLVGRVLGSGRFAGCFASQIAEYALGLDRKTSDTCLLPTARARWQGAGGDVRELLVAIAGTPELRERLSQEEP